MEKLGPGSRSSSPPWSKKCRKGFTLAEATSGLRSKYHFLSNNPDLRIKLNSPAIRNSFFKRNGKRTTLTNDLAHRARRLPGGANQTRKFRNKIATRQTLLM